METNTPLSETYLAFESTGIAERRCFMCGKFYADNPADELSLKELLASVRAVDRKLTSREEKLLGVLYECHLVKENRFPPCELLAEARRLEKEYPQLTIN